jgi:hypothetical protein
LIGGVSILTVKDTPHTRFESEHHPLPKWRGG